LDAILANRKGFFLTDVSLLAYSLHAIHRGKNLDGAKRRQALTYLPKAAQVVGVEVKIIP